MVLLGLNAGSGLVVIMILGSTDDQQKKKKNYLGEKKGGLDDVAFPFSHCGEPPREARS